LAEEETFLYFLRSWGLGTNMEENKYGGPKLLFSRDLGGVFEQF
jgi:hypothetical protein